jgi:hypothetical protein
MGRKRRRARGGGGSGRGALGSLRGGFRGAVQGVTGTGEKQKRPMSPARRALGNAVTVTLIIAAAVLLLRRFGVFH